MTFHMCTLCLHLALAMSLLQTSISLTDGNWSVARVKRSLNTVPPLVADDGDKLVYSTKTKLQGMSFKWLSGGKATAEQFSTVVQEESYIINSFDISFQDGLAFYGIDELYARPVGTGSNYLGYSSKTFLNIKYEHHFAIDWLDHNVLIYRDRAIYLINLMQREYSRQIYNGSRNVRNLLVSSKRHFFAWIDNDNNIFRSNKDGSGLARVHTENTKIFCMTLDESTSRFFYYIGGKGFTKPRSVHERRRERPEDENDYDEITTRSPHSSGYYFVLYSKDFAGRYPPEREGSVMVVDSRSEPVQVAKHHESVFVILQDRMEYSEDIKYRLGQVMRDGRFQEIVENPNWRITSVRIATAVSGTDFCGRARNQCPYLCVHMTDSQARCLCKSGIYGCVDYWMTEPPLAPTTTKPQQQKHSKIWVIALIMVLVPVFGAAAYFLYAHYLGSPDEGISENSQSNTGESQVGGEGGKVTNTMTTAPTMQANEQEQSVFQKVKNKANAAWGTIVSYMGLNSSDVSSSSVEANPKEPADVPNSNVASSSNVADDSSSLASSAEAASVNSKTESKAATKEKSHSKTRSKKKKSPATENMNYEPSFKEALSATLADRDKKRSKTRKKRSRTSSAKHSKSKSKVRSRY